MGARECEGWENDLVLFIFLVLNVPAIHCTVSLALKILPRVPKLDARDCHDKLTKLGRELLAVDEIVERRVWLIYDLLVRVRQREDREGEDCCQDDDGVHVECWSKDHLNLTELPATNLLIIIYL